MIKLNPWMFIVLGLINNIVDVSCRCLRITGGGTRFMGKSTIFDAYMELLDKKEKFTQGFEYKLREKFIDLFQEHKKFMEVNDRVSNVFVELRSYSARSEIMDADVQNLKNTIEHLKKNIKECNKKLDNSEVDSKEKNREECKKKRNLECLQMLNKTMELIKEDVKQEKQNILEKSREHIKSKHLSAEYKRNFEKILKDIVDSTKMYSTLSPEYLEKKLLTLLE